MHIEINLLIFLTTLSRSTNTLSRQAPLPNYADVGVIVIVLKGVSKSFSGVLVALIRVVYFRFAAIVYRVFQSIDTKNTIDTLRQPPAQHSSVKPIKDHREINKALLHRQIGDFLSQTWWA